MRGEERPHNLERSPDVAFHRFPDIFDADRKPIDERGRLLSRKILGKTRGSERNANERFTKPIGLFRRLRIRSICGYKKKEKEKNDQPAYITRGTTILPSTFRRFKQRWNARRCNGNGSHRLFFKTRKNYLRRTIFRTPPR